MLSFSLGEIFIVVVVIILFVKPEDLPAFFRRLGRLYGEVQGYVYKARAYSRMTFDQVSSLDQSESVPNVISRNPAAPTDDEDDPTPEEDDPSPTPFSCDDK